MQVEGGELQSALQYQVLSTGLQHGHLEMIGEVQHQQWWMLLLEKHVSVAYIVYYIVLVSSFDAVNSHHGVSRSVSQ